MSETYRVKIEKERLVFSAAHFITYDGDTCEPLHGHNYHVRAEVAGPLDENHYVIDFIALRDSLQRIVDGLDHRMLLPTEHATISVSQEAGEVTAKHGERRWVFPEGDCVLLPMANTTAELLAKWIGGRLLESLAQRSLEPPTELIIEVDECDGQWGVWQLKVE
ncbi:6-pyruvoyl trahydropterin synthase family protein [Adhaeretor mobilis]|uniref:6-carboxy-5,6,7,8-tetrahydropterin synthase n=1 Tax=Adhaeretor mobilis TaxID=1930276 RepID=A0A517MS75_9BACT|nr:6-pyruvoyl tetrahydropterin synthase family protein [Adhaeretor mobilis]QDS97728.1 6-pyruvoyl tetrahydropterin synthase [Adhaeretor mobilis]